MHNNRDMNFSCTAHESESVSLRSRFVRQQSWEGLFKGKEKNNEGEKT